MSDIQNLEYLFNNLHDSGSEEDYDAVIRELSDLEVYASNLVKHDVNFDVMLETDLDREDY